MDPREKNLPRWAQDLINDLRRCLNVSRDQLVTEIARLRPRVEVLECRNGALTELLECAARGGHKTAAEIVAIVEEFDLELVKKEE